MARWKLQDYIPNTFYEVIAYFGSATVLVLLACIGFAEIDFIRRIGDFARALKGQELALLCIIVLALVYAYGQLASTLSAPFIADPVGHLVKKLGKRVSPDFRMDFTDVVCQYGLHHCLPDNRVNNKWTLMFHLLVKSPSVGRDMLKRYAREKLARINALNALFMACLSVLTWIPYVRAARTFDALRPYIRTASPWFLLVCAALTAVFSYEYYKRKCWNNDLLVKVLPVAMGRKESRRRSKDKKRGKGDKGKGGG